MYYQTKVGLLFVALFVCCFVFVLNGGYNDACLYIYISHVIMNRQTVVLTCTGFVFQIYTEKKHPAFGK